jgi:hypothetical protein
MGRWSRPISKVVESIQISMPEIILDAMKIRNASITTYDYPDDFHSFFRPNRIFPDRYVFSVENVTLSKELGIILTPDKKLLAESYGSIRRMLYWGDMRRSIFGKRVLLENSRVYYFFRNTGFFHFLLEEIPALLYALESFGDLFLLTGNKSYPEYYYSSLDIILGADYGNKLIKTNSNTGVNKLVFTQRDPFSGGIHLKDIEVINRHFLPKINGERSLSSIYISRKGTKKRKIDNEEEIELLLKDLGFEIIYMENHSLRDQIEMIHNADYIAGPHGAGLSHIIWNPEKKKSILEIFLSETKNDCYASIAVSLGYKYDYIVCSGTGQKEICDLEMLKSKINELNNSGAG